MNFYESAHEEAVRRFDFVDEMINFEIGARWAREYLAEQEPRMAPFGLPVGAEGVQEVWDTFVKPSQSDDAPPQSVEMRELMAILRWAYTILIEEGK